MGPPGSEASPGRVGSDQITWTESWLGFQLRVLIYMRHCHADAVRGGDGSVRDASRLQDLHVPAVRGVRREMAGALDRIRGAWVWTGALW